VCQDLPFGYENARFDLGFVPGLFRAG